MDALILAGGAGTRLRPITFCLPKPLLPLAEKPILQYLLEGLRRAQMMDVVISLGHLGEYIESFCGDGSKFGLRIGYVREDTPLGTAGPIRLAEEHWGDGRDFAVVNGDVYTTFDFARLREERRRTGADLIVGHYEHTYVSPFGVLEMSDGRITGITEKPSLVQKVSAGIYLVSPRAARLVPPGRMFTMPELIHACLDQKLEVRGLCIDAFWLGIEHIHDVETAIRRLQESEEQVRRALTAAAGDPS